MYILEIINFIEYLRGDAFMNEKVDLSKCYNTLSNAYYKALQIYQEKEFEAKDGQPTLIIRIVNPDEKIVGTRKGVYRVIISISTCDFEKLYQRILSFPAVDGMDEEVFKKFTRILINNNNIIQVNNFTLFNEGLYRFDGELFMSIEVYMSKQIVLVLPKNNLNYLDVIVEASNKSFNKSFSLINFAREHGYSPEGYIESNYGCKDTVTYAVHLINRVYDITQEEQKFLQEYRKSIDMLQKL